MNAPNENIPVLTPVESSQIESIGYDAATRILYVKFKRGGLYRYLEVPVEVYDRFMAAPSKGIYLGTIIKPIYTFKKLS